MQESRWCASPWWCCSESGEAAALGVSPTRLHAAGPSLWCRQDAAWAWFGSTRQLRPRSFISTFYPDEALRGNEALRSISFHFFCNCQRLIFCKGRSNYRGGNRVGREREAPGSPWHLACLSRNRVLEGDTSSGEADWGGGAVNKTGLSTPTPATWPVNPRTFRMKNHPRATLITTPPPATWLSSSSLKGAVKARMPSQSTGGEMLCRCCFASDTLCWATAVRKFENLHI